MPCRTKYSVLHQAFSQHFTLERAKIIQRFTPSISSCHSEKVQSLSEQLYQHRMLAQPLSSVCQNGTAQCPLPAPQRCRPARRSAQGRLRSHCPGALCRMPMAAGIPTAAGIRMAAGIPIAAAPGMAGDTAPPGGAALTSCGSYRRTRAVRERPHPAQGEPAKKSLPPKLELRGKDL